MSNGIRIENSFTLDISKLAGSKLTRFRVCLHSLQYYKTITILQGFVVEMHKMKRLLNLLAPFSFNRKYERGSACIQVTHKKLQFRSLGQ